VGLILDTSVLIAAERRRLDLAAGLTLVTNNTREFQRVPKLALLDWRSGS
jgi:predicted nucleic acid-binding protein